MPWCLPRALQLGHTGDHNDDDNDISDENEDDNDDNHFGDYDENENEDDHIGDDGEHRHDDDYKCSERNVRSSGLHWHGL